MQSLSRITAAVLLTAALLGSGGCGHRIDARQAATFQEALDAFAKAKEPDDFLRAAALYQEIIDGGITSGVVFYNQGNAFMRAGKPGRAIAAYRRAQRYLPLDPRLEANLQSALGRNAGEAQRRPLIEWVLFWQDWISYPAKFTLAATAALITFAWAVAGLSGRYRRLFRRLTLSGMVVTLLLGFSAGYDAFRFQPDRCGVVTDAEVIARKGPDEGFQPAFTQPLTEGTEFRLLERRDQWLSIRLPGNRDAWIEGQAAVVY